MYNTTVFFSVLVLQWVTSKDNASTLTAPSHASQRMDPASRSIPLRVRPTSCLSPTAAYELGLHGHDMGKSQITTLVTARNRGSLAEEEERERDLEMPKMAITIQRDIDIEERLHDAGLGIGIARPAQGRMGSEDSLVMPGIAK